MGLVLREVDLELLGLLVLAVLLLVDRGVFREKCGCGCPQNFWKVDNKGKQKEEIGREKSWAFL